MSDDPNNSVNNTKKKKLAIPQSMQQSVHDGQIDGIIRDCLKELEQHDQKKRDIILKYAAQIAEITKSKQDVGIELITGLRSLHYRIDKSYVYKTLGKEYCRGFEKHTVETGKQRIKPEFERIEIPNPPITQELKNASAMIEELQQRLSKKDEEIHMLRLQIDQFRSEQGYKWIETPVSFLKKQVERYEAQKLDKVWIIYEEGYIINICDREPKSQDDAAEMI